MIKEMQFTEDITKEALKKEEKLEEEEKSKFQTP